MSVGSHTLNDFRVGHERALDELMTQVVGRLIHAGLVTVVRAAAGAGSFRRAPTLRKNLEQARRRVEQLKEQREAADGGDLESRHRAHRLCAAEERQKRLEAALAEVPAVAALKRSGRTDRPSRWAAPRVSVYRPPPTPHDERSPCQPTAADTPEQAMWRELMGTPEAQAIYRERASTIETVNADLKQHRGLRQFPVRGLGKVTSVMLWMALAYNVMHFADGLQG